MITSPIRPNDRHRYRLLDARSVVPYLRSLSLVDALLGGSPSRWTAQECGDGNLNLVFIVRGCTGAVVVKQALPYVRMVGESWPLSVRRNFFEHTALREQANIAPGLVPALYHADDDMALMVMEFLTPHSVLRRGLIDARRYPCLGAHLGLFLARTLFHTSDLRMSAHAKKERMAVFLANTAMCRISEDLIFDEPYFAAPMNRHTSPQLDDIASELTRDTDLKVAAQALKGRFLNQAECLIHGDLHTGSVMVTEDDTRVIDPEFACYGPMGFDVGVLMANFLIAYASQPGHALGADDRHAYGGYLLDQLEVIWTTFETEFSRLWFERALAADASLCHPRLALDSPGFSGEALSTRLRLIWDDSLGFAGCEIIRRIVGLAHVADFESIIDPQRRAVCELRALRWARGLLLERSRCRSIADLKTWVREDAGAGPRC